MMGNNWIREVLPIIIEIRISRFHIDRIIVPYQIPSFPRFSSYRFCSDIYAHNGWFAPQKSKRAMNLGGDGQWATGSGVGVVVGEGGTGLPQHLQDKISDLFWTYRRTASTWPFTWGLSIQSLPLTRIYGNLCSSAVQHWACFTPTQNFTES